MLCSRIMDKERVGPYSFPEGLYTKYVRYLFPNIIKRMVFGTGNLQHRLYGFNGFESFWNCAEASVCYPVAVKKHLQAHTFPPRMDTQHGGSSAQDDNKKLSNNGDSTCPTFMPTGPRGCLTSKGESFDWRTSFLSHSPACFKSVEDFQETVPGTAGSRVGAVRKACWET